ncbi:hypothetical protein KQ876_00855 [Mycoplasma sp. CSL7491-lung]|uniref:hypothetical protein n=1 Tax=Mycoplasma sp. CSL7491-lung TaxID=549718 RepID=UPI001C121529|nr:hypothetical protein [Mycoplasma sp. CSL7491-lung]MBU4692755.1 hypothetical protein [Mycoplasma sp. CSL7491-lung]
MINILVNDFGINFNSLEKSLKNLKLEKVIDYKNKNFYLKKQNLNFSKSWNYSVKHFDLIFVVIFGIEKY